jgi:hypothetical protein
MCDVMRLCPFPEGFSYTPGVIISTVTLLPTVARRSVNANGGPRRAAAASNLRPQTTLQDRTASLLGGLPAGLSGLFRRRTLQRFRWRADPDSRTYHIVVRGSVCEGASCTSRSGTPASGAAVMNVCRACAPASLVIPTAAGDPPGRRPSATRESNTLHSPTARSRARAMRRTVTTFPPLRVMTRGTVADRAAPLCV